MPPQVSKKAEKIRAETKMLEDLAKKKVQAIDRAERAEGENTVKEIQLIQQELEKFKTKTNDVLNGNAEGTGWDEQAVRVGERMKQLVEHEAHAQHNLLLKTAEATAELELKAAPIRKELPLVSDFSEEDRIQILIGIDKSIHKLKERREMIETAESKLNRQMQVLVEYTPDPAEDKTTIMNKLQMSFDVVSRANDPDRARDDLLRQLDPKTSDATHMNTGAKKPIQKLHSSSPTSVQKDPAATLLKPPSPVNKSQGTVRPPNPSVSPTNQGIARPSNQGLPPTGQGMARPSNQGLPLTGQGMARPSNQGLPPTTMQSSKPQQPQAVPTATNMQHSVATNSTHPNQPPAPSNHPPAPKPPNVARH